jgi:hypothetical protein
MGLLDDAIKEHLDLKRRRGADPTEIERAEREALGPVRRQPESEPDEAPRAVEGMDVVDSEEPVPEPAPVEGADPEHDLSSPLSAELESEPEPFERPPPVSGTSAPPEPVGPETVEYDVEQEHSEGAEKQAGAGKEKGEDVLEETPEFLQDTPDHDRLWFEQRPPKDFDFEG